jgi:hypothetical protein
MLLSVSYGTSLEVSTVFPTAAVSGVVLMVAVGFLVVLTVLWIILPFALFGTKALLRELIAEVRKTNMLLESRKGV